MLAHDPPDHGAGDGSRDLRQATLSAVRWVTVARAVVEALMFGVSLVVARILTPAEFGRAAIALIVVMLAASVLSGVFGARLVQRADVDRRHWEAGAWLSIACGAALAAAVYAAAPLTGLVLDASTVDVARLAAPAFLLVGLGAVSQASMQRRLDFRRLSLIDVAATATGAVATLALALAGLGARALVLGALAALTATTLLSMAAAPPPRPRLRLAEAWDILRFGVPAGLGSLGALSFRNIDYVVVGARLGSATLGAYWRAFTLAGEYQGKITTVMVRIAFPVFSRIADRRELVRIRARIVRLHATVIFPLLALLIVTAPELVPLLYGGQWGAAIVPVQILAVAGMFGALFAGTAPVALALGRSGQVMAFTWSAALVYGVVVYAAAGYGLVAVCVAVAAAHAALFPIGHHMLLGRVAGIPLRSVVPEAGPALAGCAAMLAVTLPVALGLRWIEAPATPHVALVGALGLGCYALVLRRVAPDAWRDLLLVRSRLRGRSRARTRPLPVAPPSDAPALGPARASG